MLAKQCKYMPIKYEKLSPSLNEHINNFFNTIFFTRNKSQIDLSQIHVIVPNIFPFIDMNLPFVMYKCIFVIISLFRLFFIYA